MTKHAVEGSERQPMEGARATGKAEPTERLEATVLVRRRAEQTLNERVNRLAEGNATNGHMSREEFAAEHGADPADIAAVTKFAEAHGLTVVQTHAGRRSVVLSGTVESFNAAFGVDLQQFEYDGGSYRGRVGAVHVPDELKGIVVAVLGLDNRPAAKPHFRANHADKKGKATSPPSGSFTPPQLAGLYKFPPGNGQGQCIAIIELGGGYRPADIKTYFTGLGVSAPKISAISVDHGRNHPTGDPNGPDGEVMLDLEVAGAVAPGAHLAVYFAPNTDAGFLDAITTAAHDTVNKPSIISISWGSAESSWTAQSMNAFDSAFQAAAAMGVSVFVASGDNGSSDGATNGGDNVDFPASSPHATGCGGTTVRASGSAITSESVWNDGAQGGASGGGVSTVFALPAWQSGLQVTKGQGAASPLAMRGVPDVCGDADPESGYAVRVDGHNTVIGGTSAVAPLWAGLTALINAAKGRPVGFINPTLYKNAGALNDISQGNNGTFAAAQGWDACTGLGSPVGTKLVSALTAVTS